MLQLHKESPELPLNTTAFVGMCRFLSQRWVSDSNVDIESITSDITPKQSSCYRRRFLLTYERYLTGLIYWI